MKGFTLFVAQAVKKEANLYSLRSCNTQGNSIFSKSQRKNVAIYDVQTMKRSYVRFATLSFSLEHYL